MLPSKFKPSQILDIREPVARALKYTVGDAQRDIRLNPNDYGDDETSPYIDVRLCINADGSWRIRSGLVDYDPYHSPICVASTINLDTDVDALADELIKAAVDAAVDLEKLYWSRLPR